MKPVLLSQRLVRAEGYDEVRDALDVRWWPFLKAAGLAAVPLPSGADIPSFIGAVGGVSGVILTGGNDLASVSDDALSARRDGFENRLCDHAEAQGLPVLGVCRGLQFLAVRSGLALSPVADHVATRHAISVAPQSRWLAPQDGREVNSYHGFAPEDAGTDAVAVVARSGDGVVEGLEHRHRQVLGIMWHPEREAAFHAADIALFRDFFGASR